MTWANPGFTGEYDGTLGLLALGWVDLGAPTTELEDMVEALKEYDGIGVLSISFHVPGRHIQDDPRDLSHTARTTLLGVLSGRETRSNERLRRRSCCFALDRLG